jgi:hypothetical protein
MAGRGRVHRVGHRVAFLPDCFARVEIVSGGDFALALSRMKIDAGTDDQGRRMPDADCNFPPLFQLIRPGFRRSETGDGAVSVGAAPPRPILRAGDLKHGEKKNES